MNRNHGEEERTRRKRSITHTAFNTFLTMLVSIALMAFTTFTIPTFQTWYQGIPEMPDTPTATAGGPVPATAILEVKPRTCRCE